jgi:DNA-binding NtrC family response regulator
MKDGSPIRVLVVDDEPPVRDSLAGFLDDYDFEVSSAESAEKALELLTKTSLDVAIVDLRLPGMSGDALILRAHEIMPAMRFLIHTGSVGYHLSEELKRIGMRPEHVFIKPLPDLTLLVQCIKTLMKREGNGRTQ